MSIVFDKTGTLTKGNPEVTDIITIAEEVYSEATLLQLAASAEVKSEHPIAQAIVNRAAKQKIPLFEVSQFQSLTSHGVTALHQQRRIFVGSPRASNNADTSDNAVLPPKIATKITELESEGKTVVSVLVEGRLAGIIAIADTLREEAQQVVSEIKHMGKEVILMSGDNVRTAQAVARKVEIANVLSEVSPEFKAQKIRTLQTQDRRRRRLRVAMVGDGINDAPALTQADVGIAMGSGSDVAMAAGHIIIMKNDLQHVILALKIGRYAFKKIKQNLAISFVYNAITMSIAAGVFYTLTNSLVLTPAIAALGWVVSDSAVFGNSLLLRRFSTSQE